MVGGLLMGGGPAASSASALLAPMENTTISIVRASLGGCSAFGWLLEFPAYLVTSIVFLLRIRAVAREVTKLVAVVALGGGHALIHLSLNKGIDGF
jgi:hypothetical protein